MIDTRLCCAWYASDKRYAEMMQMRGT